MKSKYRLAPAALTCTVLAACATQGLPSVAQAEEDAAFSRRVIDEARRELAGLLRDGEINLTDPVFPPEGDEVSRTRAGRKATRGSASTTAPERWLERLKLPDFPVRWDDQLVQLLTYYRDDPKGRALMAGWHARSGKYEAMAKEKLRKSGLPESLYYVAMVESGYAIDARSGAGAVGMWQFVEGTASEYGLTVDRWADQRLSPEHATEAAVRFFGNLNGRLRSWPLSLAAYNMGYSALLKSIRKYNSNDFWVLSKLEAGLPFETINYVAKVTACAIVAENPAVFGLATVVKDGGAEDVLVEVPGGTGLGRLARAAGISEATLATLNPELKRDRVPPDVASWELRVPRAALPRFLERWPAAKEKLLSHRTHVLRLGERPSDVAQIYGTTPARLLTLNGLDSWAAVRPGTPLKVPDVDPVALEIGERPVVGVPADKFTYSDRTRMIYRVVDGDRLEEIAKFFGVRVRELLRWNDVTADAALPEGIFLQVFVPRGQNLKHVIALKATEATLLAVGSEAFFDFHEEQRDRKRIRYRVKAGETLAELSKRFGLSVGSIARINRFSRYEDPKPNTEIILYVDNQAAN